MPDRAECDLNWISKDANGQAPRDVPYRLLEPVPELSCGVRTAAT